MNLPLDWCINEVIKIVYLLYIYCIFIVYLLYIYCIFIGYLLDIYCIEPTIIKLGSVGGRYNSPH